MYAGIATIIASNGGAQEIGIDYDSCLHKARKASLITKGILDLLEDYNLRERIGRSGRKYVLEKYSPIVIAEHMVDVYNGAVMRASTL